MKIKDFVWDEQALVPNRIDINFPLYDATGVPLYTEDGTTVKTEQVTFYELPRLKLVGFLEKSLKRGEADIQAEEVSQEPTAATGVVPWREASDVKFARLEGYNSDLLFEALADMTRGQKKAAYFAKLPLSANQLASLTDMVFKVNMVDAILASMGNWLMLPNILEILSKNDSGPENNG